MRNFYIITAIVITFIAIFSIFNQKSTEKTQKILKIGDNILNIEVADTAETRERGLSGRADLAEGEGLLFVFDTDGYYGFWMKDMNFPIDIAWLDSDKKIIYIEKNISPETYPKVFYAQKDKSPILSLYVLELPAGFLVRNNIQIGDSVAF